MRSPLQHLLSIFLGIFLAAVPGLAQNDQAALVHFGDLVEVDVVGSLEYDWRGSLTPEGFLDGLDSLPNQVYGLCQSEADLSAAIEKELKFLNNPKVAVRILDRSNRAVAFLSGAVRSPKRFQIKRAVNLNELLVLSGGITDRSSGEISIFRPPNLNCSEPRKTTEGEFVKASQAGGPETINIRIADILRGDQAANPQILSGDIVTVSEALPIYVIGGVNSPQQIPLRNQLTLTRVIAMAGGLAKEGNSKITIFRREGRETKRIEADVQQITAGTGDDPVLKAFDIVDVPQKGKPARSRPPVIDRGVPLTLTLAGLPLRIVD
ncbi:MAG TPA: SLBB domain-containing protein [Pyrinomonadaceae bacterium]|nr:SLBB domain-containing protein [Pyrinomonadaceae bacterium]